MKENSYLLLFELVCQLDDRNIQKLIAIARDILAVKKMIK